jgi:hypothetical protein
MADLEQLKRRLANVGTTFPPEERDGHRAEPPELTAEDERLLDQAWREEARARGVESSA